MELCGRGLAARDTQRDAPLPMLRGREVLPCCFRKDVVRSQPLVPR